MSETYYAFVGNFWIPSAMAPSTSMPDSLISHSGWNSSSFSRGRICNSKSSLKTFARTSSAAAEHFPTHIRKNNEDTSKCGGLGWVCHFQTTQFLTQVPVWNCFIVIQIIIIILLVLNGVSSLVLLGNGAWTMEPWANVLLIVWDCFILFNITLKIIFFL